MCGPQRQAMRGLEQGPAHDGDGRSADSDPITAVGPAAYQRINLARASAGDSLKAAQCCDAIVLWCDSGPGEIGGEGSVHAACDGVLINAVVGGEESRLYMDRGRDRSDGSEAEAA